MFVVVVDAVLCAQERKNNLVYELCIPCCVADLHAREYVFLINFFGKHVKHEVDVAVVVADAGSLTSEF